MDKKESALPLAQNEEQDTILNNMTYNIHRALSNVKSFDKWSQIYYNPFLTGGYSGKNPIFSDFSACETCNILNDFENISIDKIVLLFDAPAIGKDATFRFWKDFDDMICSGQTEILGGGGIYKNSVKWRCNYFIQWQCVKSRLETIRLEFNPNKTDLKDLFVFFSVMKNHALKYARITRLDIAIDYAMYINPECWLVKNIQYSSKYEYNYKTKTRYFGAPSSDVQIRIYDKVQELKDHDIAELEIKNFWRVEAQVKAIKGSSFLLNDIEKICNFNPFKNLEYYDAYGFNYEGLGFFSLFVETIKSRGVGYAQSELDPKTKKKYLCRLNDLMIKPLFNSPAVIYDKMFFVVYQRFLNEIEKYFKLGQEQFV